MIHSLTRNLLTRNRNMLTGTCSLAVLIAAPKSSTRTSEAQCAIFDSHGKAHDALRSLLRLRSGLQAGRCPRSAPSPTAPTPRQSRSRPHTPGWLPGLRGCPAVPARVPPGSPPRRPSTCLLCTRACYAPARACLPACVSNPGRPAGSEVDLQCQTVSSVRKLQLETKLCEKI